MNNSLLRSKALALALMCFVVSSAQASTYTLRIAAKGVRADPTASAQTPAAPSVTKSWALRGTTGTAFAQTRVGRYATPDLVVTMANSGSAVDSLTIPELTGATPQDFSAVNNCVSVAPGAECSVQMRFLPSSVGARSATLALSGATPLNFQGEGIVVPTDPYFSNVALLLHMDGTEGSQNFLDEVGHSVASNSTVRMSAGAALFGSAGATFNGSSDFLSVATSDYAFGTSDFTVEFWVYAKSYGGSIAGAQLFGTTRGAMSGYSINLGHTQDTFRVISNSQGTWADTLTVRAGGGVPLNTWTHMAVVRQGDILAIYKNGSEVARRTGMAAAQFNGAAATIGMFNDGQNWRFLNGYLEDLRVTRGIARYTGAFTPPTAPYPSE